MRQRKRKPGTGAGRAEQWELHADFLHRSEIRNQHAKQFGPTPTPQTAAVPGHRLYQLCKWQI